MENLKINKDIPPQINGHIKLFFEELNKCATIAEAINFTENKIEEIKLKHIPQEYFIGYFDDLNYILSELKELPFEKIDNEYIELYNKILRKEVIRIKNKFKE